MKQFFTYVMVLLSCCSAAYAGNLKGYIRDKQGGAIIGATVLLENTNMGAVTGLDGSYVIKNVPEGKYRFIINYPEYNSFSTEVTIPAVETVHQDITLTGQKELTVVTVTGKKGGNTDKSVRNMEKNADGVMNILSAQAIRLSPDITVANAVQRISGISIERSSNGDGQYAIVRGMDKRYNYTLINGVKIPSPNDNYRYVPLDIFPSDLLDRLEVYKSLTPAMEGDAVGGAVNMVMKDAPEHFTLSANAATGYSELFMDRKFTSYNTGGINWQSPYEAYSTTYNAKSTDFSGAVLQYKDRNPAPNQIGGLSIGNRFWKNKLGVLLAGSYQKTYRGNNSLFFSGEEVDTFKGQTLTKVENRYYAEQQTRAGTHAKIDLKLNSNNTIKLYTGYISLTNAQVREGLGKQLTIGGYDPVQGNATLSYSYRSKLTRENIYTSTLQGIHELTRKLQVQWSAVAAKTTSETPDFSNISFAGVEKNFVDSRTYADDGFRRWQHNTDRDFAGYLNLKYRSRIGSLPLEWSAGGLYRDKQRSNFYNNYILTPVNLNTVYDNSITDLTTIPYNVQNPRGGVANGQTYDASEKTGAGYLQLKANAENWEAAGGVRAEHTNQGYSMQFPIGEILPENDQQYTDFLPSLNLKYKYSYTTNLRASYYRAVNRPGFSEIVPASITDNDNGYTQRGNPDLKHAVADNFDARYELFPRPEEQLLIGGFYKRINNPIEYVIQTYGTHQQEAYMPGNFGTAHNVGLEVDYIKYYRNIGIKTNYTYTHSSITTDKAMRIRDDQGNQKTLTDVKETRPMYGQSAHIANIALLYRNEHHGMNGQLAGNYTGPRINTVSQFYNNDIWQRGFVQLDASAEKTIFKHFVVYAKVNNLLNTPMELFMKNSSSKNDGVPYQPQDGTTLMRRDYYQRSYMLGLRYTIK